MLRGKDCARRWTALAAAVALTLCSVLAQDCRDGAFYCSDGSGCVDSSMVQDGVPDCPDASDEGCLPLQFRCPCLVNAEGRRGPRCIGAEMLRDGVEDCADGADERPASDTPAECPLENQVERWKRKASEVSTRIDGPVTTSMFAGGTRRVRPTGILTSTAGTFVLDGTTTEFATKVYGTHLDDGVYAKIVSTSSRVFFAVPSAGRIRPTGLLSSTTSTRVAGTQTTYYTTEFSGTYIDGTYAQLVSSTSRVVVEPTATLQTAAVPVREDDQVVTVTGTRGALIDGSETKYDVFTGTHVKGDKTYQFFFGNTAVSATAVSKEVGGTTLNPDDQLVVRTGENDRIVVSVDDRELNLVLPESAKASAAESESMNNDSGMKGVFIEGSLGGFSILGASEEQISNSAQTEMLTVTVGRGVAQTKIVRGRYDGLESLAPSKSTSSGQSEKTVYRFAPRIPALRPPRPGVVSETAKQSKEDERNEEDENLLKARKVETETEKSPLIRPSKVHRVNLPTFTVGQDGVREDEGKVVVRVDQNVEARVGPRKDYRTLSNRQRLGKSLPFRGFQVIHEKEDLVNAESGGSLPVPTITYFGFAEFTTTAHGTVIVFQPRTREAAASTTTYSPKITAVSAYRQSSSAIQESKDGRSSESSKQKVATGVKTFYSHTPGMVTRTVTGHSLSMQTSLPTILVEPVLGLSVNGREKTGRKDDDAELVYPTSDAPEEIYDEEEIGQSQSTTENLATSTTFTENAHGRPFSVDLESSIVPMESSQVGPQSDQVFSSTTPTEPLQSSGVTESTESLPVGIIRSIEGTRALDGTTTFFTSLIYGTYIDGSYKKVIQTTSSVLKPGESSDIPTTFPTVDERVTTEETTTEFSEPTIGDTSEGTYVTKEMVEDTTLPSITTEEDVMSTIPMGTTEENDLANEVETGRKVNNTPEEQNIISDDADKEMISALGKGAPSLSVDEQETSYIYSVIPTTVYQTFTYFTTFYIPSDGTTSTSIRSREVIASDLSLVTIRQIAATATAETIAQSQAPTTPMTVEETPELPRVETTTIETPITTTSPIRDESVEDEGDEQSEEIELIFKTLYTTYTYLTTFFHDTTTSVSSREVVITNVLTSTLNSVTLATEPALAGLVRDYDSSSTVSTPSSSIEEQDEEDDDSVPTSVGVGRPTTQFFSEDTLSTTPTAPLLITPTISNAKPNSVIPKGAFRTFYTTYTYFTTVFVDGETELTSRTEVYTNIIPPSGYIDPTSTAESSMKESPATLVPSIQAEAELESQVRPSISISHPERYSSTIMHRSGMKKVEEISTSDVTTEPITEIRPIEQDSISISSENHEEKEKPTSEEIHETDSINNTATKSEITNSSSKSNENGKLKTTTEKYFGVTKFEEVGEPEKLVSEEDDQESSESNTEVVLPLPLPSPTATQLPETSILVQTTFTTFTYFTTLYRGGTSEVVSRLETVTNIMTVTIDPTSVLNDKILSTDAASIKPTLTEPVQELETTDVDESIYPITYFTTFTYWTTAYKGGSTIVNSREETVSNVVTPTGRPHITREIEHILTTSSTETSSSVTLQASKEIATINSLPESTTISPSVVSTPPLTTFYTTYTYFTTSYVGDSTIVNSRLETVTNVEAGDTQTARAIGTSPPSVQQIITPTSVASLSTGLLSTIRTSSVGEDKRTTLYSTDVYGTYIDGLYAKVLESSTKVLEEPLTSTTSELPKVNLQPTGIVSLNAGSIVDADGTATTYYSTMAIGTFIGNLYAQVVESTSSIVLNTEKTDVPLSSDSQRTGLVRLIKGSIVKGESTTHYESRVVGTVIDGRYAQIIESTSSFASAEATIAPTQTTSTIVTPTAVPELESSLGEVSSKEEEKSEEEEEEHSQEEDEEDANNANKGRITSRLTFSSRRKTFTPVIRPFSSRNRPTFHPRRRPTSATTITRVTQTPTVTATPAHTDYLAATAARGRFSSRRGGASADVRASAVGGGRRFSRIRGSSSPGVYGSSSYLGGGRGRGTSSRITPTAASSLPFANSRSRPGGFRSSFVGRTSSEYPYGRTSSSAALFAANSRFRIRPSSTLTQLRTSAISSPPPFDHNTVEDEDEENEGEEEDDVGTEKEEGSRATEPTESNLPESVFTPTTEGTTSPLRRPLLRLRRPNTYQPPSPPSTTPSPLPRSTAARRLSLLRRPSSEENLPTEDRKQSRPRYKTSTTLATKPAKAPTTPRPRPPPRLQVLNRPRPTSSLFPRRGLFRRPGEEQEKPLEETKDEESDEDSEIVEEAESSANDAAEEEDSYNLEETVADNDYEASEDVKRRNDAPQVFIRPFSPRRRRLKRQAEYGSRGTSSSTGGLRGYSNRFRRPGGSRKTASAPEAEARVGIEEEETYVEEEVATQRLNEAPRQSNSRSRNSGQQQQSRGRPSTPQSRSQYSNTGTRQKNTETNTNTNNHREPSNSRTNFRRPSTPSVRRRNKSESNINTQQQQQQQRPKPPRLRTQSDTHTSTPSKPRSRSRYSNRGRSQTSSTSTNTGRGRYRTSDLESNDYTTRRQHHSSWDGRVTVTLQVPMEATIPVINGKNTEYRRVVTASPSIQVLTPGQYEATEIAGTPGLLLLGRDVTATPTPGLIHVTQYVARETPTTSVEFTPTVIRGRKTSFSHVVPSTAYGVEEVVSTLPSESGLLPSSPLANILLSQLLLGQFGLQGNVNPLLGLQQPNAAALAPPTPTTEFKTRSTTFVTTLTDKTSTVIPITLRGKAILTTIVDSSIQVVTATEFITDTIVVTPTAAPQQQLNSLLLPALLQAQLLNQQQQQPTLNQNIPGPLTNLQAAQLLQQQQGVIRPDHLDVDPKELIQEEEYVENASPVVERRRQPSSSRRRNRPHKRVESVEDEEESRSAHLISEENPRPKTRKKQPSSNRKQNPPAEPQYETSVITLYVSGRRPGDFSTVLSTISVETGGSSLVKREAVFPDKPYSVQKVTEFPSLQKISSHKSQEFDSSLPQKDPNILISPSMLNYVQSLEMDKHIKDFIEETESLESIVGDVSKHVIYHSSSIPSSLSSSHASTTPILTEKGVSTTSNTPKTGHFLANGPAESAPLKRKVLMFNEGDEEESEDFPDRMKRDEREVKNRENESIIHQLRVKRDEEDEEDSVRPQRRRRVRVRVPVRRQQEENEERDEGEIKAPVREEPDLNTPNGSRKRIRVKVLKKPGSETNDIPPSEVKNQGASQVRSGRRRVIVTKKRPLNSSQLLESVLPESTPEIKPTETIGRHRIVVTRRRPIQRQSSKIAPTPSIQIQKELKTDVQQDIIEEVPSARKIPQGVLNEGFGSRKQVNSEKELVKYTSKVTELGVKIAEEPLRVQGNLKEVPDWIPSKTSVPIIKSTEVPSIWSSEESIEVGQSTLHEDETSGPRIVRPTRFSVTRRPSGEFLQRVQSLRTKAPIVFPSRRRPPASTRQSAYRSRLSRLRGRPSSTLEAAAVSSEDLSTKSIVTSIIPTEAPVLTLTTTLIFTPTSTFVPIYTTEVVTETLWKTYTYVVSRVESSAEAGVDVAAPPSLAAVSSSTEVKQVLKTQTVTRLVSPTAVSSSAKTYWALHVKYGGQLKYAVSADGSTGIFNNTSDEDTDFNGRAIGSRINLEAGRFNLATRIMSNGVEVIVAGDKTTLPGGPDVLRILSTASRPITLAPSTLSDQMQLTLPTALGMPLGDPESLLLSLQSQAANFVTKTYATTYTYLTTFLDDSSTVVSSREDVITNVVTEELRPTKTIQQHTISTSDTNDALTSKVDGPPSFVTSTYKTTFTYLNTIIDGEVPVVLTTRQTVANTVTAPAMPSKVSGSTAEGSDHLQPSEPSLYDTNTYFNTFTLTKTLSDSASGVKVVSTEDVLTQVVITEASTSATTKPSLKISPTSTSSIVKTYFVTYTYYNTFLEKGSTVVKTNVATSSDVVTEKFYLAPTRTQPLNKTPSLLSTSSLNIENERTTTSTASQQPLSVFATKTYMTTFTYFTTLLENDHTITRSSVSVSTNLATEAITAGLDSVYLDSLRSSFLQQTANAPIVATVMLSGTPMEITAFQGSMLDKSGGKTSKIGSTESIATNLSPSTPSNVIVGSTIIFFDDIKAEKPQDSNESSGTTVLNSESETNIHEIKDEEITPPSSSTTTLTDGPEFPLNGHHTSPTPADGTISAENVVTIPDKSYITSTITASTVIASGNGLATTLIPGDAVIVSMGSDGNVSLIPVSDPANKHPDGALIGTGAVESAAGGGLLAAASGGPNIGDLINLGSLSLNGLNALGPVFNAMAGLIQSNLKTSPSRRNDTTTPNPPTTPRTPPPISLPRPPAPQSAPLIRDPVYIPVGGLASINSENIDPIAAESSHGESIESYFGQTFPIHGFPDTEARRPPPSPVKPSMPTTLTLDNPLLLQNGIPIQPGQVITTNSDVIVGKPSVLGPRPSPHGAIPQIFPQNHPPLPTIQHSPPPAHASNHPLPSIYPPKQSIATPPRVRPSNNVPPEMKPPPPPRFPSYTGVSPTRVSVLSGVETVFIGKPLPPHMIPENNPAPTHIIPQLPNHPSGPIRPNHPSPAIPPPIVVGLPLDNLNPRPAGLHNHNTIDRSTGYKIYPSQPLNTHIDAVTVSVGSETKVQNNPGSVLDVNIQNPTGSRPGSVLNEGQPHSGAHLSLGQAQVHNVPVGTSGEVVVEIGRPPITDIHKQPFGEETKIITNENSSEENKGVVHEEGDILIKEEPPIIHPGNTDKNNHASNIVIGHGRPQHQQPDQLYQQNYYMPGRPNSPYSNIFPFPNPQHQPPNRRPPNLYVHSIPSQPSPVDHLMPPPLPQTTPSTKIEVLHHNNQPILIPISHESEDSSQGNDYHKIHPTISNNIHHQLITNSDDYLEEPEDVEGAQDGEVLQESNNHPVRPQKHPSGGHQQLDIISKHPDFLKNKETTFGTNFQQSKPVINSQQSTLVSDVNNSKLSDDFEIMNKWNASLNVTTPKPLKNNILPEAPPYPFEIPDMSPPPPPPKPTQPHRVPINVQRPPPGAVNRPPIRPQDYNPDFIDKPVRVPNRPLPSVIPSEGSSAQDNAVKPEIPRQPVRVVVRPVSPRPRPPYHNHHIPQSRPSQIINWPRPLRPIKPPGPIQPVRQSPSQSSAWQPSFSTTLLKDAIHSSTASHLGIKPTIATRFDSSKGSTSEIHNLGTTFSSEREPLVVIPSPSSPEIFVESSGESVLWDGEHFNSIPTVELPPPIQSSTIKHSQDSTLLLSGTSTIFGSLYSRPTSSKSSESTQQISDLFLSPSSHGAIGNNKGEHIYEDEDEELENEFEEGEGLGAAGSNDAATSIVVVSVTSTPTTRYVTRTETETHTVTQTVVESRPGSPPHTRTVIVTRTIPAEMARPVTIVSTIVGTVTEVHTTVHSSTTTAVTTVTVTAPTPWPTHTLGSYVVGHNSKDTSSGLQHSDENNMIGSIPPGNNHLQNSQFDGNDLSSTASNDNTPTKEKDISLIVNEVGLGDDKTSGLEENENTDEEYTTNLISTHDIEKKQQEPLCKPECDATRNEICMKEVTEEEMNVGISGPRCLCRPGFARLFPDRPCMPTYTYQLRLLLDRIGKHRLIYHPNLEDPQTEEFHELQEATQDGLERVAMQSDIRDLFHGIAISGFDPLPEDADDLEDDKKEGDIGQLDDNTESIKAEGRSQDGVIVNFYVKLSDNIDEEKLKDMFERTLKQTNYSVGGTDLHARRQPGLLEIYDFDECSNPDFNDCSDQAQCFNLHGTYTCSCKEGYADLSENSEFPGRICSAEVLGCETCKYHGQCYTDTNGKTGCKCFHWYTGDNCQINLKVLLIALVTVGAILIILVFICIMLACMKRKKPDIRHAAPGFMRYRGPAGIARGGSTMDKTAMIPDTSSESSFDGGLPPPPLAYVPLVHHRLSTSTQGSKLKSEVSERREKMHPAPPPINTGFNEQDRSLTVMIPRAKYRPAPPLLSTAVSGSQSPMTSFGVVHLEGDNRERRMSVPNEQKLLAYLDGNDPQRLGSTPTKQKQIGPVVTNHETSGNSKKVSSRKPSTGALVSAGFEVSATVVKDKWPPETGNGNGEIEEYTDEASATGIEGHMHHTLASNGSHFTTLRTGDRTVSEARSYDETIVHLPKKSLLQSGLSGCGSKPSSQHGLHHSNDEAHTMAERDVGSTFVMPQTQLYKPSRGSDNSNFDSL